jgi:mannose-1-phosphate guanylyltransferase
MNVPVICYALMHLREAGIDHVVVNLHHKREDIISFFEKNCNFGFNIEFSIEEEILETGGGLKNAEAMLGGDDFVLINSDIISDIDLRGMLRAFSLSNSSGMIAVKLSSCADKRVAINNKSGRVTDINSLIGRGMPNHDYMGIAVLKPAIFRHLVDQPSRIVDTGFRGLMLEWALSYYEHFGLWRDIGTPEDYRGINLSFLNNHPLAARLDAALGVRPIAIGCDAYLAENSVIENSVAGSGCFVGQGAVVRGSVILPDTRIEAGALIENEVIF